jgi:orotidine-5'-phosphate decarboxylase
MQNQKRNPEDYLIVAMDVPGRKEALKLAEELSGRVGYFKIGLQLFTACGPEIVQSINEMGGKIFLDLKLHDIPNTVAKAVYEASRLEVSMLTLHTLGGMKMMAAAAGAAREAGETLGVVPPRLLGVTILTSMDQEEAVNIGLSAPITKMVTKLARLADSSGLDGIVCSPLELDTLAADRPGNLYFVTPGIRPAGADVNDQSRITTPAQAVAGGARHLVVGRPITQADNPADAALRIVEEIAGAIDN